MIYGIFILSGIVFVVSPCITGVITQFYQGLPNEVSQFIEKLEEKEELERDPPKMIKMMQEIMENIWKRFSWYPDTRKKDNRDHIKKIYDLQENIKTRKNDNGRTQIIGNSIEQMFQQLQNHSVIVLGLLLSGITYLLLSMGNLFNLGRFRW